MHSNRDWRYQLAKNKYKTNIVILLFILLYCAIGFCIDLYIASSHYHYFDLTQLSYALLTFRIFPIATFITGFVAFISILVMYFLNGKLLLVGLKATEVNRSSTDPEYSKLYNIVEEMKIAAALSKMPKVYVIEADYPNAFASGYTQENCMIAVTRGLMNKLNRAELQAVVAHEMGHIKNGDTRLVLAASVLTNILLIAIELAFYNVIFGGDRDRKSDPRLVILIMVLRYLLPIVTLVLTLYLSRTREYLADATSVQLTRNTSLVSALMKIQSDYKQYSNTYYKYYAQSSTESIRRSAYIYDPRKCGFMSMHSLHELFSTHPSIKKRIKAITGSEK